MNKKLVYSFYPYVKVYTESYRHNKKIINNFHNIKLLNGTMVVVQNNNKVLLCKEYRRAFKKFVWSLPGGVVEKRLSPLSTIKKELFEETGIKGKDWILVKKFKRNGNYDCGSDFVYFTKLKSKIDNSEFSNRNLFWIDNKKILEIVKKDNSLTPGVISALCLYLISKKIL